LRRSGASIPKKYHKNCLRPTTTRHSGALGVLSENAWFQQLTSGLPVIRAAIACRLLRASKGRHSHITCSSLPHVFV